MRWREVSVKSIGRQLALSLLALALLAACSGVRAGGPSPRTLTVYAAASLKDVFAVVATDFEAAHPGVKVQLNLGGSQQLARQLAEGAPGDMLAAANERQMQVVIEAGRITAESPRVFARNKLVVIYPADNPAALVALADLARPGIKLVIASASVPVGDYTLQFLDKVAADPAFAPDYPAVVLANVVSYEDNARSVLNKVTLGEADAGIVYSSDVTAGQRAAVGMLQVPDAFNVLAEYPVAALADSPNRDLAESFIDYLLTEGGQRRMIEFGFVPADQSE